jgi:hypothetical protein
MTRVRLIEELTNPDVAMTTLRLHDFFEVWLSVSPEQVRVDERARQTVQRIVARVVVTVLEPWVPAGDVLGALNAMLPLMSAGVSLEVWHRGAPVLLFPSFCQEKS